MENKKARRFMSCFICGVDFYDDHIELSDARSKVFVVPKSNKDAMESFAVWFKNVYLKCIPQTSTILEYDFAKFNDEQVCLVNKVICCPRNVQDDARESGIDKE